MDRCQAMSIESLSEYYEIDMKPSIIGLHIVGEQERFTFHCSPESLLKSLLFFQGAQVSCLYEGLIWL